MGVHFDRLRYEVFQNLFLSPMNTGSVRPAVATTPTACGMRLKISEGLQRLLSQLQQHLPPAVCAEGCETAEEQSDDEVRTSQVPERSEGKTKVIKQQYLPPAVLKLTEYLISIDEFIFRCNNTYRLRY